MMQRSCLLPSSQVSLRAVVPASLSQLSRHSVYASLPRLSGGTGPSPVQRRLPQAAGASSSSSSSSPISSDGSDATQEEPNIYSPGPNRIRNILLTIGGLLLFLGLPFLQPTWLYSKPAVAGPRSAVVVPAVERPKIGEFLTDPVAAAKQYGDYLKSPPTDPNDSAALLEYYSTTNMAISCFVVMGAAIAISAMLTAFINMLTKVANAVRSFLPGSKEEEAGGTSGTSTSGSVSVAAAVVAPARVHAAVAAAPAVSAAAGISGGKPGGVSSVGRGRNGDTSFNAVAALAAAPAVSAGAAVGKPGHCHHGEAAFN